ncbi:hypothetical protein D3C74_311650 [compost metagenome]
MTVTRTEVPSSPTTALGWWKRLATPSRSSVSGVALHSPLPAAPSVGWIAVHEYGSTSSIPAATRSASNSSLSSTTLSSSTCCSRTASTTARASARP